MRPFVTLLCVATIVGYGYAVAGMGGYLLGHGNLTYIVAGLLGGTACGVLALYPRSFSTTWAANDVSRRTSRPPENGPQARRKIKWDT